MKLRGVNIIITSLVFTYESGDCPLSFFFAKHQLPLAKNNVRKYGAHLACSLVDLEVNLLSQYSAQIWTLKIGKVSLLKRKEILHSWVDSVGCGNCTIIDFVLH